jgi:hypothetical protein
VFEALCKLQNSWDSTGNKNVNLQLLIRRFLFVGCLLRDWYPSGVGGGIEMENGVTRRTEKSNSQKASAISLSLKNLVIEKSISCHTQYNSGISSMTEMSATNCLR